MQWKVSIKLEAGSANFVRMHVNMRNVEGMSQEQIQESLGSSAGIEFGGAGREEVYGWVERVLVAQEFARQARM